MAGDTRNAAVATGAASGLPSGTGELLADWSFKAFAPAAYGLSLGEIAGRRPSLFDGLFSPPVMVASQTALAANVATMADYCKSHGVALAPHGKTTLAPALFEQQLRAGAWGITAATPSQVALCHAVGVRRVLLANELVDPHFARWLSDRLQADPGFEFFCYVDSVAGVRLLDDAVSGSTLNVLIEVGHRHGRTGCRGLAEVREVAAAVAESSSLRLAGVAGYEGGFGHDLTTAVEEDVRDFCRELRAVAGNLLAAGAALHDPFIVSAGGSVFFDLVVDELAGDWPQDADVLTVLRSGGYVTHDSGLYEGISPFSRDGGDATHRLHPALTLWGQVLSHPEPDLVLVGAGRRDAPFDAGLPVPVRLYRPGHGELPVPAPARVFQLNDQHAFMRVRRDADVQVGDWQGFGISHPCTAMDKWQLLPVVDDGDAVVDFIRAYF
ncbi:MAG: alanine racemase [Streptosporangiales bacterium]